jgi:hypothetical protein
MGEKQFQTRAEIVLAGLAITRNRKSIFRAPAVAKLPDRTPSTLPSKRVTLVVSEFALLS